MFQLEVVNAFVNLIAEQVVKHTIGCGHYDIPVLKLLSIFFCMLWQVLTHIVVFGSQDMSQLFKLLDATLFLKDLELFRSRQDRELEWNVERVLLFLGTLGCIGFTIAETNEDKATVTKVCYVDSLLVTNCH